jgi:hypothetical protein
MLRERAALGDDVPTEVCGAAQAAALHLTDSQPVCGESRPRTRLVLVREP